MDITNAYGFVRYKVVPDILYHFKSSYNTLGDVRKWDYDGKTYKYYVIGNCFTSERIFFYFKGGNGVLKNALTFSEQALVCLAKQTNSRIYIFDYPMAPNIKFPRLQEVCTVFVDQKINELSKKKIKPIYIIGFGYGGNIATVVTTLLLYKQPIQGLILYHPLLTHIQDGGGSIDETYVRRMAYMTAEDMFEWRASPLLSKYIKCLPPTFVTIKGKNKTNNTFIRRLSCPTVIRTKKDIGLCLDKRNVLEALHKLKEFLEKDRIMFDTSTSSSCEE